jgi:hypothetical protein
VFCSWLPDFSWSKLTKLGNTYIPNGHKLHIPSGLKIFPFQDPPKLTQIWICGLKINHLATLVLFPQEGKVQWMQVHFKIRRQIKFKLG